MITQGSWFFSLTIRCGRYFTKMSVATQAEMSEMMEKIKASTDEVKRVAMATIECFSNAKAQFSMLS
jgi:hypothetical protein